MIPRYSRPDMVAIWSPETRFRIWFEIEAHACDALAEIGVIPKEAARTIWEKGGAAKFDVERIDEIERVTKHDVIAFLTHLAEFVGPDARFIHQGMTSSDVLDTCLAVQLSRASDLLLANLDGLLAALKKRAFEHKDTVTIGRSHGIHAEPTTFGVKLALAFAEFSRARERLVRAREDIATCAISGAVGTFANIDPRVEEHVAAKLGLKPEPVSTQVIPRDRHAMFFATLGVIASSVERMIAPDATVTLDFALARLTSVIDKLVIYPENMLKNLNKFRGLVHSQRVLLALTQAGVSREDAYRLVQRNAMKVWEHGADFLEELLADPEVIDALPEADIREKFDLGYHTKQVDTIFRRVFGEA
jgi:adenylosuccinate lyase